MKSKENYLLDVLITLNLLTETIHDVEQIFYTKSSHTIIKNTHSKFKIHTDFF